MARLVLPFACEALVAPHAGVRITAAQVIALLASDGEFVLPELVRALGDSDVAVRVAVLEALNEFGDRAARFAAVVEERFHGAVTDDERSAAASLLENFALTSEVAP